MYLSAKVSCLYPFRAEPEKYGTLKKAKLNMRNFENQMTGDIMHLIGNNKTQQLDSLKVLNNAFIVSKDTIGTGFNQVKGQNLYGKFKDKTLDNVDIIKNLWFRIWPIDS